MKRSLEFIALIFCVLTGFGAIAEGVIVDHRVIETTEVDGSKVPGKIMITQEECQVLAESRGLMTGEVVRAEQPLTEAEISVQEALTGRQVVSRTVSFCLAR